MDIESVIEQLELAIGLINQNGKDWLDKRDIPVLEKAIEVCKKEVSTESKWIPCYPSELPTDKVLWVTCDIGWYRYVEKVFWDMTEWSEDVSDVVAYMPYEEPEPYIGEET